MRDELKHVRSETKETLIINLDSSDGPGTHWLAAIRCGRIVFSYDSFGDISPPREVLSYFKNTHIFQNYNSEQKINTINCGHLCLSFLVKSSSALFNFNFKKK